MTWKKHVVVTVAAVLLLAPVAVADDNYDDFEDTHPLRIVSLTRSMRSAICLSGWSRGRSMRSYRSRSLSRYLVMISTRSTLMSRSGRYRLRPNTTTPADADVPRPAGSNVAHVGQTAQTQKEGPGYETETRRRIRTR